MANLVAHLAADLRTQPADWIAEVVAKLLFRRRMVPRAGVFTSPPSVSDPGGDGSDGGGGNQHSPPGADDGGEQVYADTVPRFNQVNPAVVAAGASSAAFTSQLSTVGPA